MRKHLGLSLLLVLLAIPVFSFAQKRGEDNSIARKVIGTWKLVSVEHIRPNGEVVHPWGPSPTGLIIYDSTGRMALQFMRDPRPTSASSNLTSEEKATAFDGYRAYFGTYEFNEREGTVTHHVQGSLLPDEVGIDYKRFYKLSGDRLTLTTPPMPVDGEQRVGRVTWERVK